MNKIINEFRKNTYEAYKKWIKFELDAGENPANIKKKHFETIKRNAKYFNNPHSIHYKNKLLEIENQVILKVLQEVIS